MNRSLLVPIEGNLGCPRVTPLERFPYRSAWIFREAIGAEPGASRTAFLRTSCVDVAAPHRDCEWTPLDKSTIAPLSGARKQVSRTRVAEPRVPRHVVIPTHDVRTATLVACITTSAIGIIGWLVAAYTPLSVGPPLRSLESNVVAPAAIIADLEVPFAGHPTSKSAAAISDVPGPGMSTHASQTVHRRVAAAATAADTHRTALVSRRNHAAVRKAEEVGRNLPTPAHTSPHPARRFDSATEHFAHAVASFDVPPTPIRHANEMRADRPVSSGSPASRALLLTLRSHRRLTDAPDAFVQ